MGDFEGFATNGAPFDSSPDKIRFGLEINVEAAKIANLTINSKLLRAAEIISSGKE